jgi:hypothetical protein
MVAGACGVTVAVKVTLCPNTEPPLALLLSIVAVIDCANVAVTVQLALTAAVV